jgi:membrane-bound lytic murein transglycosylase B
LLLLKQLIIALSITASCSLSFANEFNQHADYSAFKHKTMQTYGLSAQQVDNAMAGAKQIPRIVELMNTPGESKPWYQYRQNFLTEGTIQRGLRFKNQYADSLRRAEQIYGVPQSIILGILGIETGFGANKGNFITRDALSTLAFAYPRRAQYFQDELAALIAWTYQDGRPTASVLGSYAGAIGYPQFMPSNINRYGVDFDANGHIDLSNSAVDAIGSIANYLAQNGWRRAQPIAYRAYYAGENPDAVIAKPFELQRTKPYAYLKQQGFKVLNRQLAIDDLEMVNAIQLEDSYDPIYYLIYPNFHVITSYNNSRMYAAAVWLLGEEIVNR